MFMKAVALFVCRKVGWLRAELVEYPLLSSPSLPLPLLSCRDIFQLWSLNRKARSIRIDCPWRAAPLSSQCQPVCDREGEKWRKISAALAVSFPHTWVGRLPADRTVEKGGLDSGAEGKEEQRGWDWFMSASFLHNLCAPNKHTGELRLTPFILSYPGSFVITEITL